MTETREVWLEKAMYSYRLCEFFSEQAWIECDRIASAQSLRTFLKRPSLAVRIMALNIYQDDMDKKAYFFETYSNIHNTESIHYIDIFKSTKKKLISFYDKGMTPDEAAIQLSKNCDTRKEADEYSQLILKHGHPYRVLAKCAIFISLLFLLSGFLIWSFLTHTECSCLLG